ncbi:MAG: DUF4199 domain-containing protein [Prevotella sp.]|nr:DUF4199 domain-containing protein [Prevotella sp.]
MTPEEYVQLKAFARQDGALLSLFDIGGLFCYVQGLTNPVMAMLALLLIVASPFFAANRLRHFRDDAREGIISFKRGYFYTVLVFFYAGLLLAAAFYVYFAFIDNGYLLGKFGEMLHSDEGSRALKLYGLKEQVEQALRELALMRPIDYALNMLTMQITTGFLLGLPIAGLMQRKAVKSQNSKS